MVSEPELKSASANVAPEVAEVLARARTRWPEIVLGESQFARHAAQVIPSDPARKATLSKPEGLDLYLACACARGVPAAIATFERELLSQLPPIIGRVDRAADFIDEVMQRVRVRVLVSSTDGPPRIASYSATGPLGGWLAVTALRTAIDLRRARPEQPNASQDLAQRPIAGATDNEVELLRKRYAREFEAALAESMAALPEDRRELLRLYYVDDLSIDRLGAHYGVHRTTAWRWVAEARKEVLDGVRRRMTERRGLTTREFDSLAGLLASSIGLSLSGIQRA